MRIALTITELDPGGAERCLVNLAIHLQSKGHSVAVFSLGPTDQVRLGSSTARTVLTDQLDKAGVPWSCGNFRSASQLLKAKCWLASELRRFAPDIVQSMLFHANVVTAMALANYQPPIHIGGVRVSQPERWRRWVQRLCSRSMHKVVCVSRSVADQCQRLESIPSEKLVVIPNGIELPSLPISEELRPQLLDSLMPARSPFILFIGRLSSQKNVLELLRKSDAMLSQLPQHHLVLVGDGPLRQSAFQVIQQLQHSGRVHMVGWQPNATAWLANSELLVLPSLYEGMPNAVLEAMAYQKPVVCFEVEGTRELLGDDSNEPLASKRRIATDEQLVELGNWQQMEHQIVRLCTDQSLANNLATANRSRVQKHFQLRDQLNKYQQLYKAAIQTASNTHGT